MYGYRQYEQMRSKPEVSVGLVQSMTGGEAEKLFSAKGYLKARHQADIGAKVPGRVETMFVEERSLVKKGDLLAVLEHREMDALLAAREAMVKRTAAEILEAKVDLREKEREASRARRLHSAKTVSIEESEKAEAARGMSEARLAGLEASLQLQQASVRETEASIDNMKLYAPFSGTVVEKQAEVGDIITPSAFNASLIRSAVVTLASLDEMDVETDVTESLLSRVTVGQPAEISVGAVPGKHYRGVLRQIIPKSDRTRGTVKVKVEILDVDEHLFPELVATVHFLPDKALNNPDAARASVFMPKAAVVEENGRTYAWVLGTKARRASSRRGSRADERRPGTRRIGPDAGRNRYPQPVKDVARERGGQSHGLSPPVYQESAHECCRVDRPARSDERNTSVMNSGFQCCRDST